MPKFEVEVIDEADGSSRWVPVSAANANAAREKVNGFGEVVGRARLISADDEDSPVPTMASPTPPAPARPVFLADVFNEGARPPADVERTLVVAKPSMLAIFPAVLGWSPFLLITAIASADTGSLVAFVAVLVIGSTFVCFALAYVLSTQLRITTRRVQWTSGWLSQDTIDMPITKVETVRINTGLTGVLLGYRTMVITGSGNTTIKAARFKNTQRIQAAVNDALRLVSK